MITFILKFYAESFWAKSFLSFSSCIRFLFVTSFRCWILDLFLYTSYILHLRLHPPIQLLLLTDNASALAPFEPIFFFLFFYLVRGFREKTKIKFSIKLTTLFYEPIDDMRDFHEKEKRWRRKNGKDLNN